MSSLWPTAAENPICLANPHTTSNIGTCTHQFRPPGPSRRPHLARAARFAAQSTWTPRSAPGFSSASPSSRAPRRAAPGPVGCHGRPLDAPRGPGRSSIDSESRSPRELPVGAKQSQKPSWGWPWTVGEVPPWWRAAVSSDLGGGHRNLPLRTASFIQP